MFGYFTSGLLPLFCLKTVDVDGCLLSCEVVKVNFAVLELDDEISLPDGRVLLRGNEEEIMEGVISYTFTDAAGSEATFTAVDGRAFGNANLANGSDWVLEDCNNFPGCHVWKEEDLETFNKEEDSVLGMTKESSRDLPEAKVTALLAQGEADQTTISTYSVSFYYTREFAAATDDIPLFVSQVVAETNQGYINSKGSWNTDVIIRIAVRVVYCAANIKLFRAPVSWPRSRSGWRLTVSRLQR